MSANEEIKKMVAHGYNQVAQEYAQLEGKLAWPRLKWLRNLLSELEPGAVVLDLGCGSGDPADIEIAKLHRVTGVDISEAQIRLASKMSPMVFLFMAILAQSNLKQIPLTPSFRFIPWNTCREKSMPPY